MNQADEHDMERANRALRQRDAEPSLRWPDPGLRQVLR